MGEVEGVDGSATELLVVAGQVVEGGESEVVEDEVAVEGAGVEPQLVSKAYPRHVRPRRRPHCRRSLQALHGRRRRRLAGRRVGRRHRRRRHGPRTMNYFAVMFLRINVAQSKK